MADLKISELTNLTAADPANDMIPIVDVSATPPASGSTKRISINNILACSPSATLASATISGDLTVDTNTLKVDSANNRVGIGTASPVATLQSAGTFTISGGSAASSANGLHQYFDTGTNTAFISAFHAGVDNRDLVYDAKSHGWRLAAGTAMTLNSTGNLVLKGGTAGANGVGITFPTTQVASSDANCLDDYEEGTWTGTLKGSVSDPTTPVTATGRYTKIGRFVSIQIDFGAFNSTGASGNATITGLPFANGLLSCGSVESGAALTFSGTLAADVSTGGTTIQLQSITSNNFALFATHNAGNPRYLTVTLTYTV